MRTVQQETKSLELRDLERPKSELTSRISQKLEVPETKIVDQLNNLLATKKEKKQHQSSEVQHLVTQIDRLKKELMQQKLQISEINLQKAKLLRNGQIQRQIKKVTEKTAHCHTFKTKTSLKKLEPLQLLQQPKTFQSNDSKLNREAVVRLVQLKRQQSDKETLAFCGEITAQIVADTFDVAQRQQEVRLIQQQMHQEMQRARDTEQQIKDMCQQKESTFASLKSTIKQTQIWHNDIQNQMKHLQSVVDQLKEQVGQWEFKGEEELEKVELEEREEIEVVEIETITRPKIDLKSSRAGAVKKSFQPQKTKQVEMETVQVEVVKKKVIFHKKEVMRKIEEPDEDGLDYYYKALRLVKDELDQRLKRINQKKLQLKM